MREFSAEYLCDTYLDDIVRLAFVYLKNIEEAQDVSSAVFTVLLEKRPLFEDEAHAKRWLLKVCANASKNLLRERRRTVDIDEADGAVYDDKAMDDVGDGRVYREVMRLRREYREVIHMYYYEGYDTREISKTLGITPGSVRTRMKRARDILKERLGGDNGE